MSATCRAVPEQRNDMQADEAKNLTNAAPFAPAPTEPVAAGSRSALGWAVTGALVALIGVATVGALVWAISLQSRPIQPMSDGAVWTQVLAEEFDGDELNRDLWSTCYWWGRGGCTNLSNNELQWYRNGNATVEDGKLVLEAREYDVATEEGDFSFISGMVTSGRYYEEEADAFSLTYGYIEVRARAPSGQGLWPAIWMLPSDHESTPEIDIMEVLGHAPDVLEMHYHHTIADEDMSFGQDAVVDDLSRSWNVFGLQWTPDAIVWFLNGKEMWRFTERSLISSEPMYLLMNLAVGGNWPGDPDEDTVFPAQFEIDYVRAWERSPS